MTYRSPSQSDNLSFIPYLKTPRPVPAELEGERVTGSFRPLSGYRIYPRRTNQKKSPAGEAFPVASIGYAGSFFRDGGTDRKRESGPLPYSIRNEQTGNGLFPGRINLLRVFQSLPPYSDPSVFTILLYTPVIRRGAAH